jgi:hypothetical protein
MAGAGLIMKMMKLRRGYKVKLMMSFLWRVKLPANRRTGAGQAATKCTPTCGLISIFVSHGFNFVHLSKPLLANSSPKALSLDFTSRTRHRFISFQKSAEGHGS